MMPGISDLELLDNAMTTKNGGYDFISKPPDLNRLLITVRNSLNKKNLVVESKKLKNKVYKTRESIGSIPSIIKMLLKPIET
jgi:two-component system nitrogen regulation response regulator NtrX